MPLRAAAVAFAASALFIAPAVADQGQPKVRTSAAVSIDLGNAQLTFASGNLIAGHHGAYGYNRGYRNNRGHSNNGQRFERQKRRAAVQACRRAVTNAGYNVGFRDVDFEGVERIRKIGPNGYIVRAEFEFENRRRDVDRDVRCEVRRGRVVDIDGLPGERRLRGDRRNGQRGYRNSAYMTNYGGLRGKNY